MPGPRQTVSEIPDAPKDKGLRMTCARCGKRTAFWKWASDHRWCRSCGVWVHKVCAVHVMGKPLCPVCRGSTHRLYNPLLGAIAAIVLILGVLMIVSSSPNIIKMKMLVDTERTYAVDMDQASVDDVVRLEGTITCPGSDVNCTAVSIRSGQGAYLSGNMHTDVVVYNFHICDESGCIEVWPETIKVGGWDQAVYEGKHGGDYRGRDEVVLFGKVMAGQGGLKVVRLRTIAQSIDDINSDLYIQVAQCIFGIVLMGAAIAVIARQVAGLSALDRHERYVRSAKVVARSEVPSRPPGWKGVYHETSGEEGEGLGEGGGGTDDQAGNGPGP